MPCRRCASEQAHSCRRDQRRHHAGRWRPLAIPRAARHAAFTLQGGDVPGRLMRVHFVHHLADTLHSRDGAAKACDFVLEYRTAQRDGAVHRRDFDRAWMGGNPAQLRPDALDQHLIVDRALVARAASSAARPARMTLSRTSARRRPPVVGSRKYMRPAPRPSPMSIALRSCNMVSSRFSSRVQHVRRNRNARAARHPACTSFLSGAAEVTHEPRQPRAVREPA